MVFSQKIYNGLVEEQADNIFLSPKKEKLK